MNLRCFPTCDVHHFEKTFCGNNVEVLVDNLAGLRPVHLVGEFCSFDEPRSFSVGSNIGKTISQLKEDSRFMLGNQVTSVAGPGAKFVIHPPGRRWPCDSSRNSTLVLSVFLIHGQQVVATIDSPTFRIRSKRHKSDDTPTTRSRPSQRRDRAENEEPSRSEVAAATPTTPIVSEAMPQVNMQFPVQSPMPGYPTPYFVAPQYGSMMMPFGMVMPNQMQPGWMMSPMMVPMVGANSVPPNMAVQAPVGNNPLAAAAAAGAAWPGQQPPPPPVQESDSQSGTDSRSGHSASHRRHGSRFEKRSKWTDQDHDDSE